MARLLYIIAGCNGAGKTTASMTNLFLNEVDSWMIYDNSDNDREEIAVGAKEIIDIINSVKFETIKSYVRKRT